MASAVIVPKTKGVDFAHAMQQFQSRSNVNPKIHVTDDWPVNSSLFRAIFGTAIKLRLGVFHFIYRLTSTLRNEHENYSVACSDLSKAVFYEEPDDVRAVETALSDGLIGGKKHTTTEIKDMRKNASVWRNIAGQYIRKRTYGFNNLQANLQVWWDKYYEEYDPHGGTVPLFTCST